MLTHHDVAGFFAHHFNSRHYHAIAQIPKAEKEKISGS